MNKENLIQIHHKRKEVQDLQKMIKKTDEDIYRLNENAESDTVTGSRPDLTIGPIKITGIPEGTIWKLKRRNDRRRERIKELEKEIMEAEDYIESIPDPKGRRIARLRCETDMSWEEIAKEIGGNVTGDSCRKNFERIINRA